jgi:tetratricopeptide (TPR) repeat protein
MSIFGFVFLGKVTTESVVQKATRVPAGILPTESFYKLAGEVYFHIENERFSEATEVFETLGFTGPEIAKPHLRVAYGKLLQAVADCYRTQGNWTKAIMSYQAAFEELKFSPLHHDVILASLAICYLKTGNPQEVTIQMQKIRMSFPD